MSYGAEIMKENEDYYAPCDCERDANFWKMRPADAAKRLRRERRLRWAKAMAAKKTKPSPASAP